MLSLKNSLAVLRKTNALLEGHFILSSGLHSPSYVQCAKLLSNPSKASKICLSLSKKIKKKIKKIDLILSPAMGGIIIGYEIGRLLNKETIFSERVDGNLVLRRGFNLAKGANVLIVEDVITTGKSTNECLEKLKLLNINLLGIAEIVDRSNHKLFKDHDVISVLKLDIPIYDPNNLPDDLKKIPATKPGSRVI